MLKGHILIHTSVKLVTKRQEIFTTQKNDFNPHEREARDESTRQTQARRWYFNPHEREARDAKIVQLNRVP